MNKKPSNWIQGMSITQRKKHGITTVMPGDEGFGEFLDKDSSVHYNVGQVDVEVNQSHMNRLRILHMTMSNWGMAWSRTGIDTGRWDVPRRRIYEADLHKVEELMERGTKTMLENETEFLGTDQFLTKDEMLEMNDLFKTYGGKRITQQ